MHSNFDRNETENKLDPMWWGNFRWSESRKIIESIRVDAIKTTAYKQISITGKK